MRPAAVVQESGEAEVDFSTPDSAARRRDSALLWNHQHGSWFDLVWLVYSVFFFIAPIQQNTLRGWAQFAVLYAIFLLLYLGIVSARSSLQALICLTAMAALGFGWFPSNPGAAGAIIYVAAFAPFVLSSFTQSMVTIGLATVGLIAEGVLLHLNPWSSGMGALMSLAVGAGNLFAAQRMRANRMLNLAKEEIVHLAKVAERERIARDLHDVLGHTLSVVVLKSELAGKLIEQDPARARTEVQEVEQIARTALAEVREAIRGYRAEGLATEIQRVRATLDAAGVRLECSASLPKLPPAEETVLSLVLREAVTNIVRHAHASLCRIAFQDSGEQRMVTIEDDGRGGIRQEGNGLRGMRERIEALGGSLQLDSTGPTRLTIQIPIRREIS